MLAVLLALGASVAWGGADFLGGLKSRKLPSLMVVTTSQAIGLIPIIVIVFSTHVGPNSGGSAIPAILAGLASMVGTLALYRALAVGVMSVVAPIAATSAVVPVAVGVLTGEVPSLLQGLGVVLALVGVVLATIERKADRGEGRVVRGAGLALVTALAFGCFLLALHGSRGTTFWIIIIQRGTTVGLCSMLVVAAGIRKTLRRTTRDDVFALVAVGVLDVAAATLFTAASRVGLLPIVAVLASLYPLATILLARLLLGERIAGSKQAGVSLAVVGVVLISST